MADHDKTLLVIAGPTAVGKSSLSFDLQARFNTSIISADSRQVYKELSIGTAKPSKEEIQNFNIQLCDYVSIHDKYNAGIFEDDALQSIEKQFAKSNLTIVCGGTGLYISAIVNGLDKFPDVADELVDKWNEIIISKGIGFLQKTLKEMDPEYANMVDLNNPHRLIRALSVIDAGKKPYSIYLNQKKKPRKFKTIYLILNRPRNELYERIDKRVLSMIDLGLFDECRSLQKFKSLKALNTVGYSECFDYLEEKIAKEEAIELIQRHTRQYAKRQITWFKKYTSGEWINPEDSSAINDYIEKILS